MRQHPPGVDGQRNRATLGKAVGLMAPGEGLRRPDGAVRFSILGPLKVTVAGTEVEVAGPRERAALAVLVAQAGEPVSVERIADALWGDDQPRSSGKAVQNLVLRLRKLLGPNLIETRTGGYVLRSARESIDARRFEDSIAEGRDAAATDPAAALSAYRAALDLWRGTPLVELEEWTPAGSERARLEELRRSAWEEAADTALTLGDHRSWVSTLETMVTDEPLRERRWVQLMLALYRCGRQADALRAYQRARVALSELGLEPGPELQAAERGELT